LPSGIIVLYIYINDVTNESALTPAVLSFITDDVISALFPAAPVTALVIADCSYTPAIIAIVVIVIYFDSDTIFDTIAPVDAADLFITYLIL
jgi:hypothetical protein